MERVIEYKYHSKDFKCVTFDCIDSEDKAYFIGFMSADGGFERGGSYPRMSLSSTSIFIVEAFTKKYQPNHSINYRDPRPPQLRKDGTIIVGNKRFAVIAFSSKMNETFKRFGIFSYKKDRECVGIPNSFFWSFVHGIMDADGCFVIRNRKDCRTPRLNVHIVSSSIKVLEEIQRRLSNYFSITSSIYQRKCSECFELRINNTEHSKKFGKLMYEKLPTNYIFKKKKIFDSFCANSGELLEAYVDKDMVISSQADSGLSEGSETTGEVYPLNNQPECPTAYAEDIVHTDGNIRVI